MCNYVPRFLLQLDRLHVQWEWIVQLRRADHHQRLHDVEQFFERAAKLHGLCAASGMAEWPVLVKGVLLGKHRHHIGRCALQRRFQW